MDTLLKNNIEGIILKWSYQVQIMNKSPFGRKLVHWRIFTMLLIESLKTMMQSHFPTDWRGAGEGLCGGAEQGEQPRWHKTKFAQKIKTSNLFLCIFVNKGNNPGQGLDKKNIKY